MTDIYRELAASVLGKSASSVTRSERILAKVAFWTAFGKLAELPGNEHLRTPPRRETPEEAGTPAMVFLGPGRLRFSCETCHATVFTRRGNAYTCNGCGDVYEGVPESADT